MQKTSLMPCMTKLGVFDNYRHKLVTNSMFYNVKLYIYNFVVCYFEFPLFNYCKYAIHGDNSRNNKFAKSNLIKIFMKHFRGTAKRILQCLLIQ